MTIGGRDILNTKITGRSIHKVKNKYGTNILKKSGFP